MSAAELVKSMLLRLPWLEWEKTKIKTR